MSNFDLKPLFKTAIGYDKLVETMDNMTESQSNYPPYDIERIDDFTYRIVMAVAGFAEEDLSIKLDNHVLSISGQQTTESSSEQQHIIYQGIAKRSFIRKFSLAPRIIVSDAVLEDGLLNIILEEDIPEDEMPEEIPIR